MNIHSGETAAMIELIKSAGYRVFMRIAPNRPQPKYCFYTDGTRIGYAQWSGYRTYVGSVHMANSTTGTGYIVDETITHESLAAAIGCHAPAWAPMREAGTVRKYASWDEFHNYSVFNSELREV